MDTKKRKRPLVSYRIYVPRRKAYQKLSKYLNYISISLFKNETTNLHENQQGETEHFSALWKTSP